MILENIDVSYVFPIFLDCKEWTLNPFWIELFDNCALGLFPKGIKLLKNNILIISEEKQIDINGKNSFELYKIMMDVFKNDLEIISDRDKNKQSFEIINLKKKLKEKYNGLWTDIKQKQNKNNLIMDFVINKKKEFNLNNIELKQLLTTIQIGFIFKKINSRLKVAQIYNI